MEPTKDNTSGTAEVDDFEDKDPDDCYCESHSPYFGSAWGVMPRVVYKYEKPNDKYGMDPFGIMPRVFAEGYEPSTPSGYGPYHKGVVHKLNPTYSKVYHSSQKPLNIVDGFLTLKGPLYVSPYKSISSIFALRVNWTSPELDRVPDRQFMTNIGYKEWATKNDNLVTDITEYIDYCDDKHGFEPFTVNKSGYVYEILVDDEVRDHIFATDKMIMNGREVCIDYLKKVKVNEVTPIKGTVTFVSRKDPNQSRCNDKIKELKEKGMLSVNESYTPLSEFDHFFQEAKLKSKARNELDDSDFALVYKDASGNKIRKYPINDEAHVKAAARMFPRGVPNKYRKEVAGKILRRAHKFGIDTEGWKSLNNANKGE